MPENESGSAVPPEGPDTEALLADPLGIVLDSLTELARGAVAQSPLVVAGVVVLLITWAAARLAAVIFNRVVGRWGLRVGLVELLRQLIGIGVWVGGLLVAAVVVFPGMTPSRALAFLGVGSVAVGFAFKDIFENFFAGMLILWRFPFDPGDFIACEGYTGKVESITVRLTTIRQVDGQLVTLPNSILFKNPVTVLTAGTRRRIGLTVGVAYGTDLGTARDVIAEAVAGCESARKMPSPRVELVEFAGSSINFSIEWWASPTPSDERESRDEVVAAVDAALKETGIEIPFPQRTLSFLGPVPVGGESGAGSSED